MRRLNADVTRTITPLETRNLYETSGTGVVVLLWLHGPLSDR